MKNVILKKKEGYLGLTYTWEQKPLKIWGRTQQKLLDWIGRGEIVKSVFEKFKYNEEHVRKVPFKTLIDQFSIGWKLASIDRKLNSINRAPIEPGRL